MIQTIGIKNKEVSNEERLFSRLKNHFYSLYEVDQELSAAQNQKKVTISYEENEYLESLKSRRIDKTNQIKELLTHGQ